MALALGVLVKGPLALVLRGWRSIVLIAASPELRRRLLALHWSPASCSSSRRRAVVRSTCICGSSRTSYNGYVLDENVRLFAAQPLREPAGLRVLLPDPRGRPAAVDRPARGRLIDDVRVRAARRAASITVETMLWAWTPLSSASSRCRRSSWITTCFPAAPALCVLMRARVDRVHIASRRPRHRAGLYWSVRCWSLVGRRMRLFDAARLALPAARASCRRR